MSLSCAVASADAPQPPKWLADVTRLAYTDLPNSVSYSEWPEKVIADAAAAKVQVFFARAHNPEVDDGLAWISDFGPATSKMQGDGTRRVVELCHQNGMRFIAYYLAQRESQYVDKEHPEWHCLDTQGNPTVYFCLNNPVYRELVRNRVVELVTKVGCDGIFFDMLHARSNECYCEHCKAKFKAITGQEPPTKEDFDSLLWQQWVEFKYRSQEEAMLDINVAMKGANPEALLVANTWNAWCYRNGHNTRNSIRMAECVDALLEEIGWYDQVDPSFFAFPLHYNFMSWHLGGLCKDGKRAFMWALPRHVDRRYSGPTEAAIRQLGIMTNGAVPALSVPSRTVLADYMAQMAERDEFFKADRLAPWCGLIVSEKTELWYGRNEPKPRYINGVYGAYQTMLERHLPVSLVTDRDLERGNLDQYKVLFLPNCAAMSDAELAAIRRFVENGGGLVATYETSRYDEHAKLRETFGLADLFHVKQIGQVEMQSYMAKDSIPAIYLPPTHRWFNDAAIAQSLRLHSVTSPVDALSQDFHLFCRTLLVDAVAPANASIVMKASGNHAGIVETNFGKGKVVYLPFDATTMVFRTGSDWLERMLELALRESASELPPVDVAAPSIVQTMVHTQGNRTVVHLLNDISSFGRSQNVGGQSLYERREVIPIHDITLTFRGAPRQVFLMPGKQPLATEVTPEGVKVSLPPLNIHAMVVAEPSE